MLTITSHQFVTPPVAGWLYWEILMENSLSPFALGRRTLLLSCSFLTAGSGLICGAQQADPGRQRRGSPHGAAVGGRSLSDVVPVGGRLRVGTRPSRAFLSSLLFLYSASLRSGILFSGLARASGGSAHVVHDSHRDDITAREGV